MPPFQKAEMAPGDRPAARKKETKKFTWRITNFSKQTETKLYSDAFSVGGHKWRISVYPKGNNSECLPVYLQFADWNGMPDGWSVHASFTITLLDQLDSTYYSVERRIMHYFNQGGYEFGFPFLLRIEELHRPGYGYVVNDTLVIEAEVTTDAAASEAATGGPSVTEAVQPQKAMKESLTQHLSLQNQTAAMSTESEDSTVRKETKKFTWRITQFSMRKERKIYSDTFSAGGHKWRVAVFPKGNDVKFLSVYLELVDWKTLPDGLSVPVDLTLTLVGQRNRAESVQECTTYNFKRQEYDWGFACFFPIADLHNPYNGYLVRDTAIIEAEVSIEVAASEAATSETSVTVTDQPLKAIKELLTEPLSLQTQVQASSPLSPSSVQLTSRKLIAELLRRTSNCNSLSADGITSSNPDHGSGVTQQQREKLVGFLGMSLEAICQTTSLDEVESTALKVLEHSTDPVEKTTLNALLSRLAEFKQLIPSSLSTIETSNAAESLLPQVKKDMEAKLAQKKIKLSSLEDEVTRLGEEGMKLEAEIQQLSNRKAELIDRRNSTVVELEKANEEASKELEEFEKQCDEHKQAVENRLKAKERVAQSNASWKLFKENLDGSDTVIVVALSSPL